MSRVVGKDKKRESDKRWREANAERLRAQRKEKYWINAEESRAKRRKEYKENIKAYVKRAKEYKKTDQGKIADKRWRLKKRYGMSVDAWDSMYQEQNGLCKICKASPVQHTDHCHTTGKIRGLLCHKCNAGLGMFNDDPELFTKAIAYLARPHQ